MQTKQSIFKAIIKTNCSENKIIGYDELRKAYKIELKAKPVEGEANRELIKFLSKELGKQVRIKTGFTSKEKLIEV